ncbi:type IV pilin N-terminal domain-containing protein [Halorubrum salinarum]|uniref:Type IV pilin N-terminal domain-containing protein n=1 Tax=Halorubrum salinarum TaxID=2739057 RepID=A0A7D3XUL3_9EURY|nr:type IV pilin N-terminal domain-containing protein [Halorubrum salinarum]QKG92989.1 type IV pilin N-terminal domain-containing protein [Halorubrum salinarum]
MDASEDERAVSPVVGVVLLVAITAVIGAVLAGFALGLADDLGPRPTFAALELTFEEEPASAPQYDEFRWDLSLTNTAGGTVDAEEIVVYLDHGDQRVTGTLDRSLRPGETVELTIVHNNQDGDTIPAGLSCSDVNVACRLAGDTGNFPEENRIRLQMVHEPSGSILYREQVGISGEYGIFNGNPSDIDITDETLTFA